MTDRNRFTHNARRGFTLVELVVVIIIIALLGAIAVPRFAHAESGYKARAAAAMLADMIAETASEARARSMPVQIKLDTTTDRVTTRDADNTVIFDVAVTDPPYRFDITNVRIEGERTKIIFDGFGNADRSGVLVCQAGGAKHTVLVDARSGTIDTGTLAEAREFETDIGTDGVFTALK